MSATLYAGSLTGVVFGTTDETEMVISNLRRATSSEVAELTDGEGDIVAVAAHGKKIEVSGDFSVIATGYLVGDDVAGTFTPADSTLGIEILLTSVENVKQRGEFLSGSFTGMAYPDIDLSPT